MLKSRIDVIDGFRAVAVLGVLWVHVWMFFDNARFNAFGIDVGGLLSFFGTGVDLFFVISGFCMYLMYVSRTTELSWGSYGQYLKKRWLRIAPAFYAAIFVYGVDAAAYQLSSFDWLYATKQAFFIRNIFAEPTPYAPHFWSLCTEWHFYLVLPFVIFGIKKYSFSVSISFAIVFSLLFRLFFWQSHEDAFSIISYSIPNRLIEFLMGVVAARIFVDHRREWIFQSWVGLLIGLAAALSGRFLMSASFNYREDIIGVAARVFDLPLLSMGYALVIVNVLLRRSIVTSMLEHPFLTRIGKYSYSMYLWHWIVSALISHWIKDILTLDGFIELNIAFALSFFVLYPLSFVSYRILEDYYFQSRKKLSEKVAVTPLNQ